MYLLPMRAFHPKRTSNRTLCLLLLLLVVVVIVVEKPRSNKVTPKGGLMGVLKNFLKQEVKFFNLIKLVRYPE